MNKFSPEFTCKYSAAAEREKKLNNSDGEPIIKIVLDCKRKIKEKLSDRIGEGGGGCDEKFKLELSLLCCVFALPPPAWDRGIIGNISSARSNRVQNVVNIYWSKRMLSFLREEKISNLSLLFFLFDSDLFDRESWGNVSDVHIRIGATRKCGERNWWRKEKKVKWNKFMLIAAGCTDIYIYAASSHKHKKFFIIIGSMSGSEQFA